MRAFLASLIRLRPVQICFFALVLAVVPNLRAQTDNFDSGSDAAWAKITSPTYPATYSFPPDGFGGLAYRLEGAATPSGGPGRVVAYRPERIYTNFYVAVDIINWDNSTTNDQVFGVIARGTNIDSGLVDGVTWTIRMNRFSGADGNKGQIQIYSFFFGDPGVPATQNFGATVIPGHRYRFIMTGVGNVFSGYVYDLEDLTHPLVAMTGDDSAGPFTFPPAGYVGIFNASLATGTRDRRTDTTFDNFVASELPPGSVAFPATPHGMTGMPQVVNRSPASYRNFHPAASGITFNAATLTTTNTINTNAIRLYLNGVDVSAGLSISGPATNALIAYSGLTSNAVYQARIELQDAAGRRVTNAFTFDTFLDAYLASNVAKNIECEDYDYTDFSSDGLFIDDPLPSGLSTNGAPVNASGRGYYNLAGNNTFDFFTPDGAADASWSEFRTSDAIRTLQGSRNYGYYLGGALSYDRTYDTQRQKYIVADPALEEYGVIRTRGSIWMNYTRTFPADSYYNVYLRHACAFSQDLTLSQAAPGPFTGLGTFKTVNALGSDNFLYAPLLDNSNKLAVVHLSGTNTLQLGVAGIDLNRTRFGLYLNYLALVPALLVESSAQVNGPYALETNAAVEPGTRQITLTQNGGARFYRLRWDHAVQITSIKLAGDNVVLAYR